MPYMLGKKPAQKPDPRALWMYSVLSDSPVPTSWSFEKTYPKVGQVPTPLWRNDRIGNCVIVSEGHLTLRMEAAEHGRIPAITEQNIVDEYLRQSGGNLYSGLYMDEAAREWRLRGLPTASGKRERIAAYGSIRAYDDITMKRTLMARLGLWIGLALPWSALDQFDAALQAGKPYVNWTLVNNGRGERNRPGSAGGHAVAGLGWQWNAWHAASWGMLVKPSPAFMRACADEVYGVVDVLDGSRGARLDETAVRAYLMDKQQPEVD
jgi:hypothetical protein